MKYTLTTIYETLHIKLKNRVTLTPLKTGDEHSCPGRAGIPLTLLMGLQASLIGKWIFSGNTDKKT
jgi:hypothetical protein